MASPSAAIAEAEQLYESVFAQNNCGIAATVLFLYDNLLNLDREIQFIWASPKNAASLLYLYNRYIPVLWSCLGQALISSVPQTSCEVLGWMAYLIEVLGMLGPAMFTTLRIYALTGKNKWITGATFALSIGPFVVNTSTIYQDRYGNLAPPVGCSSMVSVNDAGYLASVVASRGSLILADLVAIVVTWRKTYTMSRMATDTLSRSSLSQVMLQNGIVYFCTLVSLNILSIILSTQAIYVADSDGSYAVSFVDPISAVLSCHFLLNLRQTSEMLADASAATVSSLNFGERNDPPQIPPLSPFLNSLGGPIFPQIDMQGEDGRFETEDPDDGEPIPSAYMPP